MSDTEIGTVEGPEPIEATAAADDPKPTLARALLAIVVVLLVVAIVAAVVARPTKASPDGELASVRSFVGNARTAHFVTDSTDTYGTDTGPGNSSTDRSTAEGDLRLPDEAHVIEDFGQGGVSEFVAVKHAVYSRDADTRPELANKQWAYDQMVPGGATGVAGGSVAAAGSLPADVGSALGPAAATFAQVMSTGGDSGLPQVLASLRDPVRVETHVIRATLDLGELARAFGVTDAQRAEMAKYDGVTSEVTVTITSGSGGRLDRMVWKSVDTASDPQSGDSGTSTEDTTFSKWDLPVTITVPDKASIDPTPDVDEPGLASVHDIALLAPGVLPDKFKLTYAEVLRADDSPDGCRSVNLTFSDPVADAAVDAAPPNPSKPDDYTPAPMIDIYEMSASCSSAPSLEGAPFAAGTNHGFSVSAKTASWSIDSGNAGQPETDVIMRVGDTLVEAAGTVSADQVRAALASLAPLDLTKISVATVAPPP